MLPDFADVLNWWDHATVEEQCYLKPSSDPPKKQNDYESFDSVNLKNLIEQYVSSLQRMGLEMYALDLTRPDISMPVARVIVPELRHFWRRLAPGRLYDVPISMGWRDKKIREEEANPISLFL